MTLPGTCHRGPVADTRGRAPARSRDAVRGRPAPPPVAPVEESHSARLLRLQRTVGNAAVRGLIGRAPAGVGGRSVAREPPVVQRAPAFGLATSKQTSDFAKRAVHWRSTYPGTALRDYAVILIAEAGQALDRIGVPSVDLDDQPSKGLATFHSSSWTIGVRVAETGFTETTKVGDLPAHHLADFANTVFHEARHAEQRFLMARLAVGRSPGKDARAIADEVKVPVRIAAAAITAGSRLSAAQQAKAETLREFFDQHVGYKMWVTEVMTEGSAARTLVPDPRPPGVDAMAAAWTRLAPRLVEWHNLIARADRRIATLEQQRPRSPVADQVLRDSRATRTALQTAVDKGKALAVVVDEWPRMQARQTITDDLRRKVESIFSTRWDDVHVAVVAIYLTANDAYERYPEEADARAVGDAVATATLRGLRPAR